MTTVIEWHNARVELPEESGDYLVNTENDNVHTMHYSKIHKAFNCYDWCTPESVETYEVRVKWWAKAIDFPTDESEVLSFGEF